MSLHLNSIAVPFAMLFNIDKTLQRRFNDCQLGVPEDGGAGDTTNEKRKNLTNNKGKQKNCKTVINMNKKHPKRCRSQVIFQSKCQHFHLS